MENTTLDPLEMVKNAYYHFLQAKNKWLNPTFKSAEMKDFRKPTVDQMSPALNLLSKVPSFQLLIIFCLNKTVENINIP